MIVVPNWPKIPQYAIHSNGRIKVTKKDQLWLMIALIFKSRDKKN
jgi:hypothetical protein